MLFEYLHHLRKVEQAAAEAVDLVDDHAVDLPDQPAIDCQMGEERLDFLIPHLSGMNPMAGAIVMEPQKFLDPTAVGLNGSFG